MKEKTLIILFVVLIIIAIIGVLFWNYYKSQKEKLIAQQASTEEKADIGGLIRVIAMIWGA